MSKIRIVNVPTDLISKVKILAKDNCKTMTNFLRPVITEISKKYNDVDFSESELCELSISGISPQVVEKLEKIAKKTGVTVNVLLRLELYYFIENQSEFNKSLFTNNG
tara:strand:- start:259 stop:582 length:324 start_codon:yes stop_codon:yes gene_type:complete